MRKLSKKYIEEWIKRENFKRVQEFLRKKYVWTKTDELLEEGHKKS